MAGELESHDPDLYELLGVDRGAHQEEIVRAWRRQALAVHPDTRAGQEGQGDAGGRFRAVVKAYQVLSDPGRRAAYDRALAADRKPAARPHAIPVPVRVISAEGTTDLDPMPVPPLWAGPVRVERQPAQPTHDYDDVRRAVLAELALRWLAQGRVRSW